MQKGTSSSAPFGQIRDTGCRIQDTGSSHFGFLNANFGLKEKVKNKGARDYFNEKNFGVK